MHRLLIFLVPIVYTGAMKLTIAVQLQPTAPQSAALLATLERANAACNALSVVAWESSTFGQYALHRRAYHDAKTASGLTAQVIVRCIAKVADAYKLDRRRRRTFRSRGSIAYDSRILRWYPTEVSIWTTAGRERIPFVCGERERALLTHQQGESDLVYRDGRWFLYTTVVVAEPSESVPTDVLGADFGIVNILVDSDGTTYSGSHLNALRHRHRRLRRRLQAKGTKSAKRLLRKRRRKERRFSIDVNHTIAKRLVATAQGTGRAIAIENLTGIRDRVSAPRQQRATLHSWAFSDLRAKVDYKARLAGVRVVAVDPRNTSRTCVVCGNCDKNNRPQRDSFLCTVCGFAAPADHVAALNLRQRGRAVVNQPHAGESATSAGTPASSAPRAE